MILQYHFHTFLLVSLSLHSEERGTSDSLLNAAAISLIEKFPPLLQTHFLAEVERLCCSCFIMYAIFITKQTSSLHKLLNNVKQRIYHSIGINNCFNMYSVSVMGSYLS